MTGSFLDLLYEDAADDAFDAVVAEAERAGADEATLGALRADRAVALRLRERLQRHRRREAEQTALYETANDLTAIRDVDAILAAIVRRARQLLGADMTYLSLNDEAEGASYMKVTDGSVSAEFRNLRLPLGTGLLGLVAQSGAPYYTDDYQSDERFLHRDYIDHAVGDERIRAILGVPLVVEGTVIGALLAGHRTVRAFPPEEVALLTSFAAHAAVALENARLFEATRAALADLDAANRRISEQARAVEVAAEAHDRLTDALLHGGGVDAVAAVLADVLDGRVCVLDDEGRALVGSPVEADLDGALAETRSSGRSVEVPTPTGPLYVAAALAGAQHLGTLVIARSEPLGTAGRRVVERGAVVTALVLLFSRTVSEAEDRVRGELLADLLSGRERDPVRLRERARRHHADLDGPVVLAVADLGADAGSGDLHRAARVAARLGSDGGGLGGAYDGRVVLVLPGADAATVGRTLHERLARGGDEPTVGVAGADAVTAAWTAARSCLATLLTLGRTGEVSDPEGLGLARLVLGHNGPAELDAFVTGTLGPLLAYDERRGSRLVDTLEAWFAAGGGLAEAARRLHVHPNTVTQRLDRVTRLLGEGWRDPARALDLQLALQVWRLRNGVFSP